LNIAATLIASEEAFASTLLIILLDRFGDSFLSGEEGTWTPETLRLEIKDHFDIDIPDDNLGKLIAAIAVLTTDNFYRCLPSFLFTVHGLLGDGTSWSYAEPIDLEDLAWAMQEAILLSPPQEDLFDSQIVAYCQTMVKREGLLAPPAVLTFAKEEEAYGHITSYDENVMIEQADRTNAVNEYIEEQIQRLLQQISSIPSLNTSVDFLKAVIMSELEALYAEDKWL
jgi:hypothetical protein